MADKRFVEWYEEKEKKCENWKNFIDIKKSIVFCSALGGILGALVGMPAGGAVCGGVMGTNAQESLRSLVDWFVGPSEDDKKKYEFYTKYEDEYLSYAKTHADNNGQKVDFKNSEKYLLSGIQGEIEECYKEYCKLNKDKTYIDINNMIGKNIKKNHPVLKNVPERKWWNKIGDTCKDLVNGISNVVFGTDKGKVVKSLEEIVPNKHISTYMDPKDREFMGVLYEKIRHKQEITINFVDKCSPEQNNENSNTKSDTLYLSRDMFSRLYRVFYSTKFEKEKMPTKTNLSLFDKTYTLLFGATWDASFLKAFRRPDFSREKDIFPLNAMSPMKWKVKKRTVNGESCSTKNEKPCTTKTLEYFFADISNYIQDNKGKCLTGNTKSPVSILGNKYGNNVNKKFDNSSSSINTSITSRKSLEASSKK